jgi:hypothetical protein
MTSYLNSLNLGDRPAKRRRKDILGVWQGRGQGGVGTPDEPRNGPEASVSDGEVRLNCFQGLQIYPDPGANHSRDIEVRHLFVV